MPPHIEVSGVFTPDKGGEREVCHYIQHDNGQCGDSAEEAEDLACSEENADKQETHNLKDLLDMNRYGGRVFLPVGWLSDKRGRAAPRHHLNNEAQNTV